MQTNTLHWSECVVRPDERAGFRGLATAPKMMEVATSCLVIDADRE